MENELGFAPITINEIAPPNSRSNFRFAHQPTLERGQYRRFNPYSYPRRARSMPTSYPQGFEEYLRRQTRRMFAIFPDQRPQRPINFPSLIGMIHPTNQPRTQPSISDISRTMLESKNMADYFFNVMQLVSPIVHNGLDLLEHMRLHGTHGMGPAHVINNLHEMLIMQEATMAGVNLSMSMYQMAIARYMSMYPRVALTTQRIPTLANPWETAPPNMGYEHPPPQSFTGMVAYEQQHPVVHSPASTFYNGSGGTTGEELDLGVVLAPASNFANNGSGGTTVEELDSGVVHAPASNLTNNRSGGTIGEELDLTLRL